MPRSPTWHLQHWIAVGCIVLALPLAAAEGQRADPADGTAVRFRKLQLTDQYYCDGVSVGDFNRDGHLDIVAGPFWYEGPDFQKAHEFYPAESLDPAASPSNSMYSFVHDFDGDGWDDILVLGRVHLHEAFWYRNPGDSPGHWEKHFVFERIRGESPLLADVTGDGHPELVCHWDNRWGLLRPDPRQPTAPWRFTPIMPERDGEPWPQFYHGTGIGDVDGDGRLDLILNDGWWRQPADPEAPWEEHSFRFAQRGGAQMFAVDVDGDGLADIITSLDAHGWGLAWFQQQRTDGGEIRFEKRTIMGDRSQIDRFGAAFTQPHALAVTDVNGNGLPDIITGKRRWAHGPTGDIEPDAPPVVYWFECVRDESGARYVPHLIDDASGVGVQITACDLHGNGRTDILTASKLGTFVFLQEPVEVKRGK